MKVSQNLKTFFITLALSLGFFLIAYFDFFQKWSWILNDSFLYSSKNTPSSEIVIVAIDDKSLSDQALGRWQDWSRENYAQLIEVLEKYSPAVIAFDITFSESSKDKKADQVLADAIHKYNNIVLGQDAGLNPILPAFKRDNSSVGIVEFPVDADQKVRQVQLDFPGTDYDHFSIAILKKYLNFTGTKSYLDVKNQKYIITPQPVRLAGSTQKIQTIPLNPNNRAYLNFFGPPNAYRYFSFVDVLNGNVKPEEIKGKIILVGEDASSLYDEKFVPISEGKPMPGVEIHANFIQTILDSKFLIPQTDWQEFITIFLTVLISAYLFIFLRPLLATLSFFLIFFLIILIWAQVAPSLGRIVNIFYIIFSAIFTYITIFIYRYMTVEKARRKIEKAFSMYVSSEIVEQIKTHPEMLHLGGEKRVMTTLFSDIAGFTSISESMAPEALVPFLNEYFAAMTKILFKYRGTLDKYEGDAIMAFWNAPLLQAEHARLACHTALKMQMHLKTLSLKWKKEGKPQLKIRIGINTGEMIVGNVGSEERFDYTVMGDAVNLSSRLEGVNKYYGTSILVAESTYQAVQKHFEMRQLDLLKVKGKSNAVKIYELICSKGELESDMQKLIPHYNAGLDAYYHCKFNYALIHFEKAQEIIPTDQPTQIYINRCQIFQKNPPDSAWDGSYQMETK